MSLPVTSTPAGEPEPVYATISIPWGDSRRVSYSVQKDNRGGLQQTVNYSDFHNPDTTWNISAGHNRYDTGSNSSFSGSVQSRLPWGRAAADATLQLDSTAAGPELVRLGDRHRPRRRLQPVDGRE